MNIKREKWDIIRMMCYYALIDGSIKQKELIKRDSNYGKHVIGSAGLIPVARWGLHIIFLTMLKELIPNLRSWLWHRRLPNLTTTEA